MPMFRIFSIGRLAFWMIFATVKAACCRHTERQPLSFVRSPGGLVEMKTGGWSEEDILQNRSALDPPSAEETSSKTLSGHGIMSLRRAVSIEKFGGEP